MIKGAGEEPNKESRPTHSELGAIFRDLLITQLYHSFSLYNLGNMIVVIGSQWNTSTDRGCRARGAQEAMMIFGSP
jgi:hypothetical protein